MELKRPAGDVVVRPVPEHRADEELSAVYRDLKTTLGVPWVGVVTQAFAHHRPFFLDAWRQFRPTAASAFFHEASDGLRRLAWDDVAAAFDVPSQRPALEANGYSAREIEQIRDLLDLFDHGNPKYLILATVIRASVVEGRRLGPAEGAAHSDRAARGAVADVGGIPVMIEEHHAFGDLRALYADIKSTLNLPFVNSDYKAMARWPSYLKQAWESLKPRLTDPAYGRARERLHARAVEIAAALPFPFAIDAGAARALGMTDREIEELARTAGLFQWLLSGLMLNVSHFKLALARAD
jgi:hypothetical protein